MHSHLPSEKMPAKCKIGKYILAKLTSVSLSNCFPPFETSFTHEKKFHLFCSSIFPRTTFRECKLSQTGQDENWVKNKISVETHNRSDCVPEYKCEHTFYKYLFLSLFPAFSPFSLCKNTRCFKGGSGASTKIDRANKARSNCSRCGGRLATIQPNLRQEAALPVLYIPFHLQKRTHKRKHQKQNKIYGFMLLFGKLGAFPLLLQ